MSGLVLILLIVFTILFWLAVIGAAGWKPTPAAAKPAAAPAPAPAAPQPAADPAPAPASAPASADDLTQISGIGPTIAKKLADMGVTTFAEIAAWTREDVEEVDERLNFKGRIDREDWIAQAKKLAEA